MRKLFSLIALFIALSFGAVDTLYIGNDTEIDRVYSEYFVDSTMIHVEDGIFTINFPKDVYWVKITRLAYAPASDPCSTQAYVWTDYVQSLFRHDSLAYKNWMGGFGVNNEADVRVINKKTSWIKILPVVVGIDSLFPFKIEAKR